MCGRYAASRDATEIAEFFEAEQLPLEADPGAVREHPRIPNYNVAPTTEVYIVVAEEDGSRSVDAAHWGLIPSWSKDATRSARMINARSETVADKPAYRAAFRRRRCLVPADGYYEWQARVDGPKQPFFIHRGDGQPLAFAGLYEDWDGPNGTVRSCTILTQDARGELGRIHDRMPVLVPREAWGAWLDPTVADPGALLGTLVADGVAAQLRAYPVSTSVNKPTNNGPGLLERVADTRTPPAT